MDYYPEYNTQQQEAPNVFRAFSSPRVTRFFSSLRRLNNYQARSARPFFRRRNIWKRATGMKTENRNARHCILALSLPPLSFFTSL